MMQIQKLYQQAISYAAEKHAQNNQKIPGTNLPYVVHLSNVAMELFVASSANDGLNMEFAVQVALLHDLIEDTDTTCEEIEDRFGVEIMNAVKALTKNNKLPKDQQLAYSLRRSINYNQKFGLLNLPIESQIFNHHLSIGTMKK